MNTQEQQLLEDLFQRLQQTHGVPKDPQAQALIERGLAITPDATYWLAQRTLLLEQALQQAQQQLEQLKLQAAQSAQRNDGGGFLSGGLGTHFGRDPEPAQTQFQPAFQNNTSYAAPAGQGNSQAPSSWRDRLFGGGASAQRAAPAAQPGYASAGSAGGSFLGSVASAAAGVAGGMFLFNGLENLLGGHQAAGHGTSNSLWGNNNPSQPEVQENVTQNFYGNDSEGGVAQLAKDAGRDQIFDGGGDSFDSSDSLDDDSFA